MLTMTTQEIANRLVNLCKRGQNALAQVELYDDHIESIELYSNRYKKTKGIAKVQRKTAMFFELAQKIHHSEVSEPLVAGNHFCIKISLDVTLRGFGRVQLEELCIYHVKDEKIFKEEFFYTPSLV
ncbi:SnoaL-like domain-containing protein [Wenyingzhuangia fucanilytica]|nr:SnoaL-like domain-containing protein [Wenyingzhuangia fucanilytica]